jgi:hypothetical protein
MISKKFLCENIFVAWLHLQRNPGLCDNFIYYHNYITLTKVKKESIIMKQTKLVMWRTNIKPTTCDECRERHGKIYDFWKLDKFPPLHPNCGCKLVETDKETTFSEVFAAPPPPDPAVTIPRGDYNISTGKQPEPPPGEKPPAPATTQPAVTERVPETIPDGGVYGMLPRRESTTTNLDVPSRWRTAMELVFRFINNLKIIRFQPGYTPNNYSHNKDLLFDGELITNQNSGTAADAKMGIAVFSSNACGWIAAYNALLTLGVFIHPADIIKYIEENNGLIAHGSFGTNPLIFDRLFENHGISSTTTLFYDALHAFPPAVLLTIPLGSLLSSATIDLDHRARQGRVFVLTYWNNKNDMSDGAHYVAITWSDEEQVFTAWNVGREGIEKFATISEFLGAKRLLISMTVII